MKRSWWLIGIAALLAVIVFAAHSKKPNDEPGDFRKRERKIIAQHASILMDEGRMPIDFGLDFDVLGRYDWHPLGNRGGFGAYQFHQPAFEQAKRSWWIIGVMKAGSDLLVAINQNARFKGDEVYDLSASDDGTLGKTPPMNSPVGFKVGYMYNGPTDATVVEVINIRTLRLSKKADHDVLQYDLPILPPDYVDMCNCKEGAR
jgi:hypothetical protein